MGLPRNGPFESVPYPAPPWGMSIPCLGETMACPRHPAMGDRRFSIAQKDPVVYQAAADNVARPLPIRLHRVTQPVLSSRTGFSTPHATLLT